MIKNKIIYKNKNIVSKRIDEEYLLIPLINEVADMNNIFGINEVGAYIWDNIEQGKTVDELINLVLSEFEISNEIAKDDVEEFIRDCVANGLVIQK